MSESTETVEQTAERLKLSWLRSRDVREHMADATRLTSLVQAIEIIQGLEAENAKLRADAESFHMDYRVKCDKETKDLHVENATLRADLLAVAQETGIVYQADGHNDAPGPASEMVRVIRDLRRRSASASRRRRRVRAKHRQQAGEGE